MRIGSRITRNEKGNYHLAIAERSIITTKTRQQAEKIRELVLTTPAIYRLLGEYSAVDLMTRIFERPNQVKSDEKYRHLRDHWGQDAEIMWNTVIVPKLLEKQQVEIEDEPDSTVPENPDSTVSENPPVR